MGGRGCREGADSLVFLAHGSCLPQVLVKGEGGESEQRPSASPKRESACQARLRAVVWFTGGGGGGRIVPYVLMCSLAV